MNKQLLTPAIVLRPPTSPFTQTKTALSPLFRLTRIAIVNGKIGADDSSKFSSKQIKKRIVREFLDIIFLVEIKQHAKLSGYDLAVSLKNRYMLSLSAGTVYSQLHILERGGLIIGFFDGKKTTFSVSPQGEEALAMFHESSGELSEFMRALFSI